MSHPVPDDTGDLAALQYIVTHVFCPLQLPGGDDRSIRHECSLVETVAAVLRLYGNRVEQVNMPRWDSISRMLDNLQAIVQFESLDRSQTVSQLIGMDVGDVLAFHIRAQNVAVLFRKQNTVTIFESFEVSPKAEDVMTTQGKLICSYPGPAIEIPNTVFEDEDFLSELANFLVHMHDDTLDAAPTRRKAQSTVLESRDTAHPRYITELLTGILRSVGRPADVVRITKRVGDDVVWNNSKLPWRRSSLWLLIRVAIQTSLDQPTLRHDTYKQFMLFFMCRLANEKICVHLPNDILQSMSAKISRRLRKLGSSAPKWLSRTVLRTCTSLRSILENRWKQVQAVQHASPIWVPSQLDLTRDVELSLLGSRAYIRNRLTNRTANSPDTFFTPTSLLRGYLGDFLSFDGAFFDKAYRTEPHVALYDVERAVEQGLDVWVDQVTNNDGACVMLETLGNRYSSGALNTYGNNPELLSVMLLTMIELWVALDKIAIKQIPMLADYSPEVPTSLLEDLLLCKTASLSRLRRLHEYLSRRHSQSKSRWSVFSSTVNTNTFGVRYYGQSSRLQSLKSRIEEVARREVDKKVDQLEKTNAHYTTLKQKVINSDHASAVTQDGREIHPRKCQKCQLERRLARMDITVHEWPLPAGNLQAELVVFELDCPVSFNMWRTATLRLLVDLCSLSPKPKDPYLKLDQYAALRPYLVQHPRSRISLGSDAKPFVVSHYSKARIPTTQNRVCVNNGLSFYGFDSHARVPVSEALAHVNARRFCTYELESGPYQNLQKYVDTTSHTSNAVLANQIDCHKDISIHEYLAFGHLRSGGLLQWLNILRNLRDRSLTFRRPEVHSLIAQAVSQVGPLSEEGWAWHEEIREPTFCFALITELESLLNDIKANWLEGVTMDTISFLLRRLLTSSTNRGVSEKVLGLLRTMRQRMFSWVMDLSEKLAGARGDEELRGLLRDTAAICRSTFDFDPATVRAVLCCAEDVEILLSSAIFIHDNTPGNVSCLPAHSRLLLARDRRLSLTLESALSDIIRTPAGNQGISRAINRVWPLYRPGSKWMPLHTPNSSWFSCQTAPTTSQRSQVVSFHLLDGSLLVDGKPLGRLPDAIVRHPLYNLIFGKQLLDVTPADLPGMDYSIREPISGHQVYFSLRDEDLVIRAKEATRENSETIELIPHEQLKGDLPEVLIEGHAHWLNLSTSVLEIRPLDKLWKGSSDNWSIDCTPGRYRMRKGSVHLVDIRSPTWAMISGLLEPLDSPQNLIISISPPDTDSHQPHSLRLSVDLPRYGLSFFVDEDGDLQSRNIRGMVYDNDQSIGTMFGLVNQLVLRPKSRDDNSSTIILRCVLIPEGDISFQKNIHHVHVEIDIHGSALRRITYQTYRVDVDLGCLTGNVSLTNKLYCAYLHALTSGCGTDPLTGRTGTEEALSLLRSGGCWSIMRFGPREAELLALIASICPSRTWYPEHLKCMQKVEWRNLPASTQHHDLYLVANGIKEHCESVLSFQENQSSDLFKSFPLQDEHLLQRSALRAAYLFPSESPEQSSGPSFDVRYQGRDVLESSSGEQRAYTAATAVYYWTAHAIPTKCISNLLKGWKDQTVSGNAPLSLQYDRSWLNPNLPSIWLEAYNLLRECDEGKWTQLFFSLPAMAYTSPKFSDLVPVFVAFATDPRFGLEDPPPYNYYNMSDEDRPSESTLRSYVFGCTRPFEYSPEYAEPAKPGESSKALRLRQLKMYNDRLGLDADVTVRQFLNAWPCETPPWCHLNPDVYDVATLMSKVEDDFSSCYRNLRLKDHLSRVQTILNNVHTQAIPTLDLRYSFQPSRIIRPRVSWSPTVDQLLTRPAPSLQSPRKFPRYTTEVGNTSSTSSTQLNRLIGVVEATASSPFQRKYVSVLRNSAYCFGKEKPSVADEAVKRPTTEKLMEHYTRCRGKYLTSLDHLQTHLGPISQTEEALEQAGQWPRVTAPVLLRFLASNSPVVLSDNWKKCLTTLAMLMLELQRARRLLRLHLDNLHEEFCRELENEGCNEFAAEEYPDWLLIQLQGNFLIRRVQVDVANEMISPSSGRNTAMQLNMGEGKSSVIVPISVAALADGDQVVRVIVPKALTAQMFQLLVDRLGGLANRRVYYIPFSRSLDLNPQRVVALRSLFAECLRNRGILVVQPEHVLSLKLVSVEKQLSRAADDQVPALLLELQKWLHSRSRDILDESDEILHVRYQLVYTIGLQQHMEGFPERWTTTQQVLGFVGVYAPLLARMSQYGIEYESGPPGSFPHFRILQAPAGQNLISQLVQTIMDGALPNFNFQQYSPSHRRAIQTFIRRQDVSSAELQLVKDRFQHTPLWGGLLLLRGLLATGILLFAFTERRWRVDYGLAPTRTMLAVPYRAKDVPAQRAEFGHPDVAIILTCLSYYYGGLDEEQLRASFEILLKQDDPSLDYGLWVKRCYAIPEELKTLSGINIKSSEQWQKHLLPQFSRNKATIDFYLSRVVFPREAKEFPSKLSCSGWDLAEKRERLLTGFSGTNDGQYLLPLDITQHDPKHQQGTNAKVLAYLLQPENNSYMCTAHTKGGRRATRDFLKILVDQKPEIRVLLDVGAQMLDLQNHELAKEWLDLRPDSSAAIYFNEDDELTVLTRDGGTQLLLSSPFAQQLDQCVIYLDDAHTRGTDINFPSGFRAAVTLGPKVTKDRLAQGCMRMRKLGRGHSVMFFAPIEVDRRIRHVVNTNAINAMDILQWAISETWADVQQRAPHWAQQGMDHTSRYAAWTSFCGGELSSEELSDKWLQPEAKRLEDLYRPRKLSDSTFSASSEIRRRCTELGAPSLSALNMDEEQEREVVHEAERERQIQRPPKVPPATHSVHPDVVVFAKTGVVPPNTKALRPAFVSLNATSAGFKEAHVWSPNVLVTTDFEQTVQSSSKIDDYLRPVMWVAFGKRAHGDVLVILSPYEVNNLLPVIRSSDKIRLHVYTPRTTKSMKSCDDLALYTIPKVHLKWTPPTPLMDQLNVFAGQVYLQDHKTYIRLCRFLCVYARDLHCDKEGIEVGSDGFIAPCNRPKHLRTMNTFQNSPLDSLKTLMGLRRKGTRFAPTHIGRLVDGQLLAEDDFDDCDEVGLDLFPASTNGW